MELVSHGNRGEIVDEDEKDDIDALTGYDDDIVPVPDQSRVNNALRLYQVVLDSLNVLNITIPIDDDPPADPAFEAVRIVARALIDGVI